MAKSVRFSVPFAAILLAVTSGNVNASIVQTNNSTNSAGGLPVSNTDLFQTNLASATSTGTFSNYVANNALSILTNGQLGIAGTGADEAVFPNFPSTITFILDTVLHPLGYQITSLASFASWDPGRDGQAYTVAYSTAANPGTFIDLFTLTAFNPPGIDPSTSSMTLTQNAGDGTLATGVAALRYTFTSFENFGTAYREFDASGSAVPDGSVPEPGTLTLMGLALAGLTFRAHRRR